MPLKLDGGQRCRVAATMSFPRGISASSPAGSHTVLSDKKNWTSPPGRDTTRLRAAGSNTLRYAGGQDIALEDEWAALEREALPLVPAVAT
jgi:hypothetical protein